MIHLLSLLTKKNLSGTGKGGNMIMDPDVRYALVVAAVNRGFSGDVMVAAKTAGAGGGTVIHSRGIEDERVSALCGTAGDEEKEIVLIISEAEKKLGIMQSISENCGMKTDAKGIVISLPIETVMGI